MPILLRTLPPTKSSKAKLSDEALMDAYAEGDHQAFAELHRRHAGSLARLLRARGVAEEDARELVQQSFLQLHRARVRYRQGSRFRPWLVTIAFNLWRDDLRRARRWREVPLEHDVAADAAPDPLARERAAERVRGALTTLSSAQRTLLELHWFEELTYREIATRCGATPGAVKLRAHRAHATLRSVLAASLAA